MKKVQNGAGQDRALDELYKRYDRRGMTYDRSPEYAEQKKREISTRTAAPRSYKISAGGAENLRKYKNGIAGGRKYMTDGDFANYYRATREYTPESNVELDTTILLQRIDRARYKNDQASRKVEKNDIKAKLKAEANRANPKNLQPKRTEKRETDAPPKQKMTSAKIKKVAKEAAREWIPLEERNEERVVEGTKTKIPGNVILAIVIITVSLLLIVGSAVLLGSAQKELNELENAIAGLDAQIAQLQTDLNKKNEGIDIEIFAEEELGMINQEHVNAEYISSNKTDGVEKKEEQGASLTSLINWIFQSLQ